MLGARACLLLAVLLGACVQLIPLDGRPCPCVQGGYRCCDAVDLCIRETLACPAQPGVDSPPTPNASPSAPRWQALSDRGLPAARAVYFDLRVADDGTPFLLISKEVPLGLGGNTVLRHDGSAWQQLGGDLPGSEFPAGFVLTGDGIPHVLVGGAVHVYQQGRWQPLATPAPSSVLISDQGVSLARDGQGRLYAFARPAGDQEQIGVMRFSGGRWQLLGRPNSFGTPALSLQLAADRDTAYVALLAISGVEMEARRWSGSDWVLLGGGLIPAFGGEFVVSADGTAYLTAAGLTGIHTSRASTTGPWTDLPVPNSATGACGVSPAVALGRDGALTIAYCTDRDPGPDIVPGPQVTRLVGNTFADLPVAGLDPTIINGIKVGIAPRPGGEVVYLAYSREFRMVVKRLDR